MAMELSKLNQRKNLARWQQQIYECRNSGMTIKAWCEEHGVARKSYYYHQGKVWQAAQEEKARRDTAPQLPQPVIIPCASLLASTQQEPVTAPAIVLRNETWTVEVNGGCDPELLQLVLRAVKRDV